jgi:ABC-type lipoprotein release transport system permease subunit
MGSIRGFGQLAVSTVSLVSLVLVALFPALKATKADPVVALRCE